MEQEITHYSRGKLHVQSSVKSIRKCKINLLEIMLFICISHVNFHLINSRKKTTLDIYDYGNNVDPVTSSQIFINKLAIL
jgi:S-adenosylmethionine/arginine decarboxylase-like enzyme